MTFDPFAPDSARQLVEAEQMDAPGVDERRLEKALRFIRRINFLLAYNHALGCTFHDLIRDLPKDSPVRVLDVATGSGDAYGTVSCFGGLARHEVEFVGLDLHARTLATARRQTRGEVALVQGNALELPFEDGAFDIAITSMFLHHLPTESAIDALHELGRVARHGIIAADLIRDRRAYRWICLMTLLADRMVRHDARVSVRQAFTIEEADGLRVAAGLDYARIKRYPNFRFVMSGRKP